MGGDVEIRAKTVAIFLEGVIMVRGGRDGFMAVGFAFNLQGIAYQRPIIGSRTPWINYL